MLSTLLVAESAIELVEGRDESPPKEINEHGDGERKESDSGDEGDQGGLLSL